VSPHGLDAKSIEAGRGALQPRAELARAKKATKLFERSAREGAGNFVCLFGGLERH